MTSCVQLSVSGNAIGVARSVGLEDWNGGAGNGLGTLYAFVKETAHPLEHCKQCHHRKGNGFRAGRNKLLLGRLAQRARSWASTWPMQCGSLSKRSE